MNLLKGGVVEGRLVIQAICFESHPKRHRDQPDRTHAQSHHAFLQFLARESLDVVGESPEIAVWLLRQ